MNQTVEQQDRLLRGVLSQLAVQPADRIESETIEVKGWCNDAKDFYDKMAESAACLANAHGGLLLMGIAERGSGSERFKPCPYGGVNANVLRLKLEDVTMPPVVGEVRDASEMLAEITSISNAQAFAFFIPKTEKISGHITAKGVSKIRVGKECRPNFTAEDDRTRLAIPGLTLADLSANSMAWAMSAHQEHYRRPYQPWASTEEFLTQAGLMSVSSSGTCVLTLASLLLFGTEGAFTKHLGHCETVVKMGAQTVCIRKNIVDSYRELCSSKASLIASRVPRLSPRVLKELIINAFVHRCYRVASGVTISIFDHSLSIQSPGGLAAGLNTNNLVYCLPVYRNLLLAEGARFIGLCDKFGQGLDIVYRSVLTEGFDFPIFEDDGNTCTVTIPLSGDEEFREFVKVRSQALSRLEEIVVLRVLYSRGATALDELASAMQRGRENARGIVDEMIKKMMVFPNLDCTFELAPVIRKDIENVFRSTQLELGI